MRWWWSGGGGESERQAKKKAARESEKGRGRQRALESQVRCPLRIPLGLFGTLVCLGALDCVDNQG